LTIRGIGFFFFEATTTIATTTITLSDSSPAIDVHARACITPNTAAALSLSAFDRPSRPRFAGAQNILKPSFKVTINHRQAPQAFPLKKQTHKAQKKREESSNNV
jgi:hypothetical protein